MSFIEFAKYSGGALVIYYVLTIGYELVKGKSSTKASSDDQVFDVSDMIEEGEQKVNSVDTSSDVKAYKKKK